MHNKTTASLFGTTINQSENNQTPSSQSNHLDTQIKVKQKIYRRKFTKQNKLKILEEFDSCKNALERGTFLRKEGLYYASITKWRLQLSQEKSKHSQSKVHKLTLTHNQVMRENIALKKKLAQAEAIIDLQKKVSELLSTHVLNQEMSEEQS